MINFGRSLTPPLLGIRQRGSKAAATLQPPMRLLAAAATPSGAGEPTPPRLSLVVLPFLNIGGSAEDDPIVDGITETLTTDLSRSSGVFVISRSTASAYKGKPVDTRQIGRGLGVRYVLEGSVQKVSDRIRINAQLVDAESGAHLWRFDKRLPDPFDMFDMQDEITTRLARTIQRASRPHASGS